MADNVVQVLPNSTGKKVDTSELVVGANTVERQRIVIADDATAAALAKTLNAQPAGTEYGLVVREAQKGQATAANSRPVVIASDQSAVLTKPTDGTNLITKTFNLNTGVGADWQLGVGLRKVTATGSVEAGTATDLLRVDPTGTTVQPVSGTVTANAGTGTLATDPIDRAARLVGQVEGRAASGAAKAGNPNQVGGVFNTTQPTVLTGQAVEAQATARGALIVASGVDALNVTVNAALPTGANVIGALSVNQSVNVAQIAGTATGTAAAGVQKVGVVGNAGAVFDAATAAAVPTNAVYFGARGTTIFPTAVTDGQTVGAMADKAGRQAIVLNSVRDLVETAALNSASGVAVTLIAAGAVGVFNDIISYIAIFAKNK